MDVDWFLQSLLVAKVVLVCFAMEAVTMEGFGSVFGEVCDVT